MSVAFAFFKFGCVNWMCIQLEGVKFSVLPCQDGVCYDDI